MEENQPDKVSEPTPKTKKFKKEHKFAVVGFALGALIAGSVTFMFTKDSAQLASTTNNDDSSQSQTAETEEEALPEEEVEVVEEQEDLEEGVVQEEEAAEEIKETNVALPSYTSAQFGKAYRAGTNSIVIHKVERGVTHNAGTPDERFYKDRLRVYFTIKNLGEANTLYGFDDFTLEAGDGEVKQSMPDLGLGEFGWATLVPNASKKGFVVFSSSSDSGTIVWTPDGSANSGTVKVTFKKK